ncbi:cytochrome c oxidase assembly protein [Gandjariella thermophila]|uniref:Copper resistance protein D n=1 Tax=Gandjariella thermophila TaxID=1931992 RepID=A0A4D4JD24_9PSEU|nr:cytochrome c oxidase assembly protein [Gandjariella thermophila]GDY32279.1 hypothetical protein GTS_39120 [Gandjariella thermophila]
MSGAEPLTWRAALTVWDMPLPAAVLLVLAAALYLWGVTRAARWPWPNTVSFLAGLLVTAVAVGGSVGVYSHVLFVMHMVQHLALIAVAPILLVLGHPLELLRRTTTGRPRDLLRRAGRSRVVTVVTHPLVVFVCYAVVVFGTHLTGFQQGAMTVPALHPAEEVLYLASGYLLALLVLGDGPLPRRFPYLMRVVLLLVGMVVDTVVGVTLLMTTHEPFPAYAEMARTWGPDPLTDLHWGGALMWVGGDGLMTALAIVVIAAWLRSSEGGDLGPWLEAARRSALLGTGAGEGAGADRDTAPAGTADIDEDEEALRAYNAMLARLSATERDQHRRGPDAGTDRGRPRRPPSTE